MCELEQKARAEMENIISVVLDEKINPKLLEHQGWVELEKIVNNNVFVRFRGACRSCAITEDTLNGIVKPELMNAIEEINDVLIADEVDDELIDFARSLLTKKIND